MTTIKDLEKKLRAQDYRQAKLYLFCNFISLMLITAYAAMMLSPTILHVLPEGGDSRKQMTAIFVLTLVGCLVFTVYATNLFFRQKSKQIGVLMAIGASEKQIAPMLYREILILSLVSSTCGILAGFPLIWLLWNGFRLLIIDSAEMALSIDLKCLIISVLFLFFTVTLACITARKYIKRTDILDTIREEHINEPVKELGRWCGPVGVVLLLAGAVAGFETPAVWINLFSSYPPMWSNITYAPVFIGLYMILLHTVVHGWRPHKTSTRKNLISRSMMKFQGRQTVNNLLVSTVLIAGACFAIFYIPMLGTGMLMSTNSYPYDYLYLDRADQNVPKRTATEAIASEYGLSLADWNELPYITLGEDGNTEVEEENGHFHYEYRELLSEKKFISESGYENLTGQSVDIKSGTYLAVTNDEETFYYAHTDTTLLTNMTTGQTFATEFAGYAHYGMLTDTIGYNVVSDEDFSTFSEGLADEWRGTLYAFNIAGEDSYFFADELFHTLVASFDERCEFPIYYDRVTRFTDNARGEIYWGDTDAMTKISYENPDSTDFRNYWTYMPKFRILDRNDFMRSFAVFLMMFLFIFLICVTAACIICYTRCQTIALNNRYLFEDLRKLGAPPAFLIREVKQQCRTVIRTPSVIGICAMTLLYSMIMYGNDGRLSISEIAGLGVCGLVILLIILLLYFVYRKTVRILIRQLGIE